MVRVAVLDRERCKPKDCQHECRNFCPEVRNRIDAVVFSDGEDKPPIIVESLCTGCGICVKKCPYKVITIINLPEELKEECSHRYGPNMFKLFRLPIPKEGVITGLIGRNGTGKTTALRILFGEIRPNLGEYDSPPNWENVTRRYRGSILQNYFERLSKNKLKVVYKPQHVDMIPRYVKGRVSTLLKKADRTGKLKTLVTDLQLKNILNRSIDVLSGGELQRVAITAAICREADVYIFDEPSSHLDVSQRLRAAKTIRSLVDGGKTVLIAEHDLAMLDYLSDQVCVLYGEPGAYGIISHVHGVRVGINIYLDGFIPDENMRFRSQPIKFHVKPPRELKLVEGWKLSWSSMEKSFGSFKLRVDAGEVRQGETIGILGPNGIGKTTFIKLLAKIEKPDKGETPPLEGLTVSYKPQYISAQYEGSVDSLLRDVGGERYGTDFFEDELVRPLALKKFLDRDVKDLSGGELQRVAIATCLVKEAHVYLIDEPSAYLDVEERLAAARAIRKVVEGREAFGFVVEHDIVAQDFIADRLMIFTGKPGAEGHAESPVSLRDGMNSFLTDMKITFRRDPVTGRPRVNKPESKIDRMQKGMGEYYYVPEKESSES